MRFIKELMIELGYKLVYLLIRITSKKNILNIFLENFGSSKITSIFAPAFGRNTIRSENKESDL
jgi:hypothetical protein